MPPLNMTVLLPGLKVPPLTVQLPVRFIVPGAVKLPVIVTLLNVLMVDPVIAVVPLNDIAKSKLPERKTMEFAFMFIPSETIYYDMLMRSSKINSADLIEYAFNQKHVIIVSPTNFLAYLQTVLQGLRAFQIEENAKEIRNNVEKLGKHITAYDD